MIYSIKQANIGKTVVWRLLLPPTLYNLIVLETNIKSTDNCYYFLYIQRRRRDIFITRAENYELLKYLLIYSRKYDLRFWEQIELSANSKIWYSELTSYGRHKTEMQERNPVVQCICSW